MMYSNITDAGSDFELTNLIEICAVLVFLKDSINYSSLI